MLRKKSRKRKAPKLALLFHDTPEGVGPLPGCVDVDTFQYDAEYDTPREAVVLTEATAIYAATHFWRMAQNKRTLEREVAVALLKFKER